MLKEVRKLSQDINIDFDKKIEMQEKKTENKKFIMSNLIFSEKQQR